MNEREMSRMLLDLDAGELSHPADARMHTARILERDRRRGRWLMVFAVGLWTVTALLVMGVLVFLGLLFPMKAEINKGEHARRFGAEKAAQIERDVDVGMNMTIVLTALAVGVCSGAVLFTLLLVINSRRATLRQVNANLLEICEQLRRLQGDGAARALGKG